MNERQSEQTVEALAAEFVECLRGGQTPAISDYTERYPQLADEIRDLFPMLARLETLAPRMTGENPGEPRKGDSVGPYLLLGEIGRGGMAIVFDAEDERTGQRVALKILPTVRSEQFRERFRREARSNQRLHHTHIVPVLDSGESAGLQYIAMQRIDGSSLQCVLQDVIAMRSTQSVEKAPATRPPASTVHLMRDPTDDPQQADRRYIGNVVRIGIQVAEAIAHAHAQGVFHRDIKPSNVLLDRQGDAWVTDFGLAKVEGDDLTRTGDIVGTPRYMAPERLRGEFTAASDVYSIGITLYELLAYRPAFMESDRVRLLHQIETARPPALRTLNAAVPRDIETVVSTAISRDPRHRYESVADLAQDLRRAADGEPVRARRPSLPEQFLRWSQTHPALATALSLFLVALLSGLLAVTWQWRRANAFLAQSRTETRRAERERRRAESAEKQQRELAEYQSRVAQSAEETLQLMADLQRQGKPVNADMLAALDAMSKNTNTDAQRKLVSLRIQNGLLKQRAGRMNDAIGDYQTALEQLEPLLRDRPDDVHLVHTAVYCRINLGHALVDIERDQAGIDAYDTALALLESVPDARNDEYGRNLHARARHNAAFAWYKLRDLEKAEAAYREVIPLREQLAAEARPEFRNATILAVAQIYHDLALLRMLQRDRDEALELEKRALQIRDGLRTEHPSNREYQFLYATTLNHIGDVHRSAHRFAEAIPFYEASIDEIEGLIQSSPNAARYRHYLGNGLSNLGSVYVKLRRPRDVVRVMPAAVAAAEHLLEIDNNAIGYLHTIAHGLQHWAQAEHDIGRHDEAEKLFERSLNVHCRLIRERPAVERFRRTLEPLGRQASDFFVSRGQPDHAAQVWQRCLKQAGDQSRVCSSAAWFYCSGPTETRDPALAIELAKRAIDSEGPDTALLRTLGTAEYRAGRFRDAADTLATCIESAGNPAAFERFVLAACHFELGDPAKANEQYTLAVEWWVTQSALAASQEQKLTDLHADVKRVLKRNTDAREAARILLAQQRRAVVRHTTAWLGSAP